MAHASDGWFRDDPSMLVPATWHAIAKQNRAQHVLEYHEIEDGSIGEPSCRACGKTGMKLDEACAVGINQERRSS